MSYGHNNYGTKTSYISTTQQHSRLRVVHNVANGPNVDALLDGNMALKNFSYKAISDYLEIKSGVHVVSVYVSDTTTLIGSWSLDLNPGQSYTLIVHGLIKNLESIAVLLLEDNLTCPMNGKAHVRFIHAAASIPAVDIYAGTTKVFSNVSYGQTGNPSYLPVQYGQVNISVTVAGDNKTALGPLALPLSSGGIYTIIATGLLGDRMSPLSALVSEDSKGTCIIMHHL